MAEQITRIDPRTTLGRVVLVVEDLDRGLRFYGDALGLHPRARGAGVLELAATENGAPLLELREYRNAVRKPPRTTGLYHVAILFPNRQELANAVTRLITSGVPLTGASDHLVSEAIYLDDPAGNGLELYADRPRETWRFADGQVAMDTKPLDLNGLLATAQDWSRPAPPETRIGHIHLHVADLRRAESFYHDVIGLDLMLHYGRAAAFLSAGGYHHHLGLNTWAGVGAPRPPANAVGLREFTIVLPDAAALRDVSSRMEAAGYPFEVEQAGLRVLTHDPDGNRLVLATEEAAR